MRPTAAILLACVACLAGFVGLVGPAAATAFDLVPSTAYLRSQVREPVFAWVFTLVNDDSLGTWTGADAAAFAADWTQPSDFPLERLASFRRAALPESLQVRRDGLVCDREITITLNTPRLDMAMPYSILGYHPGTLSFGSPVVVHEWRVGDHRVTVHTKDAVRREEVQGMVVFEIVSGWTILDVDGWLDKLLGDAIDDAATVGFVAARGNGRLLGVSDSLGRDGRFIFGELDFRKNTVAPHGRPLANAVARLARRWCEPPPGHREAMWAAYDAAGVRAPGSD